MCFYGVEKSQIIEIDVRRIRWLRDEPAKEVIYLSSAHLHLQLSYEALFRVWTGTILLQKIILTSQPRALLLYHIKHTALHCEQFLVKVAVNIPIYHYHRSFRSCLGTPLSGFLFSAGKQSYLPVEVVHFIIASLSPTRVSTPETLTEILRISLTTASFNA